MLGVYGCGGDRQHGLAGHQYGGAQRTELYYHAGEPVGYGGRSGSVYLRLGYGQRLYRERQHFAGSHGEPGGTVCRDGDQHFQRLYIYRTCDGADRSGNTFGGGGRLTKTAGGWTVEVLGKNKRFSRGGRELFNISTRTLTPISVTGSLSRASRVVNGGSFEVIHNKAQFVATYVPSNLTWSSACCHPVSGSLAVTYAGSVTGSSSVTFNGCGTATMVKDGLSSQITLNYCE